jgi:2-polyprenyl-6-hydroxyphenyl methylase/3-demethylubiquinone-9 3-methyltransferase
MEKFYERYWKEGKDIPKWTEKTLNKKYSFIKKYLNGKILDVGCGEGVFTSFIHDKNFDIMGCDISKRAIKIARQKNPKITFLIKDFNTETNFMNESFDGIILFEVIEHIYDTNNFFKELNRITKIGGGLFITTPQMYLIKNLLVSFLWDWYFKPDSPHIRFYTFESLKKVLNKFGFEIIEHKSDKGWFGLFSKSMFVIAKKVE